MILSTYIFTQLLIIIPMCISHNYLKLIDQTWLEPSGGQGIKIISAKSSNTLITTSNHIPVGYLTISSITGLLIILSLIYKYKFHYHPEDQLDKWRLHHQKAAHQSQPLMQLMILNHINFFTSHKGQQINMRGSNYGWCIQWMTKTKE